MKIRIIVPKGQGSAWERRVCAACSEPWVPDHQLTSGGGAEVCERCGARSTVVKRDFRVDEAELVFDDGEPVKARNVSIEWRVPR